MINKTRISYALAVGLGILAGVLGTYAVNIYQESKISPRVHLKKEGGIETITRSTDLDRIGIVYVRSKDKTAYVLAQAEYGNRGDNNHYIKVFDGRCFKRPFDANLGKNFGGPVKGKETYEPIKNPASVDQCIMKPFPAYTFDDFMDSRQQYIDWLKAHGFKIK